jgi:hypothetical protein
MLVSLRRNGPGKKYRIYRNPVTPIRLQKANAPA